MNENLQRLSRWYVYELVDPRSDTVFYVGKGTGSRMHHHEAEFAKGVCSKKTFKIKEIKESGFEIAKRQIAFFWDEQSAYDHETDRIDEIGLENLTNVLPGGQKAWERRRIERAVRKHKERTYTVMEMLTKHAGRLAYWMLNTQGGKYKATVILPEDAPQHLQTHKKLIEFSWNELMPKFLKQVTDNPDDIPKLVDLMSKYGINLSFVEAQHGCA